MANIAETRKKNQPREEISSSLFHCFHSALQMVFLKLEIDNGCLFPIDFLSSKASGVRTVPIPSVAPPPLSLSLSLLSRLCVFTALFSHFQAS